MRTMRPVHHPLPTFLGAYRGAGEEPPQMPRSSLINTGNPITRGFTDTVILELLECIVAVEDGMRWDHTRITKGAKMRRDEEGTRGQGWINKHKPSFLWLNAS